MRILVIFNSDTLITNDTQDNSFLCINSRKSIESVANAVERALHNLGYKEVSLAPIYELSDIEKAVALSSPDLIFNLCESIGIDASQEVAVARLLESLNIPFTGNYADALEHSLNKFHCNQLLLQRDIPTPHSFLVETVNDLDRFEFSHQRYIVKPNDEDGSAGIDDCCVVDSIEQLYHKVNSIQTQSNIRLIVQEYIEGREINFSFVGTDLNPHWCTSEIEFNFEDKAKPKILNYASKWLPESPEFHSTNSKGVTLESVDFNRMAQVVKNAQQTLGLHAYGRFDFRVDKNGTPFIIDVNPNCDLDPSAGMARANNYNNLSYDQLINSILHQALK